MSNIRKFQPRLKVKEVQHKAGHLNEDLFQQGYEHGLQSNELIDFRESFRAGFRKAKIEIRQWYRQRGIEPISRPWKFSIN